MSRFKQATREKSRLRLAIDGPSGSGKTFTILRFAAVLAKQYSTRIAAIDTEHGSMSKYVNEAPDEIPFKFDVLELKTFAPTEYTAAIQEAGREGYGVIIVDSLSHAWTGEGGALEIKDQQGGNSFTAWKNVTPQHNRMIEAITSSPAHVLTTMRSKTEWILEPDEKGRQVPRRVGLAPVQRAGMEYEFDVYASIDHSHTMTVSKSRCPAVQDLIITKPGASFMGTIIRWLDTGEDAAPPPEAERMANPESVNKIKAALAELGAKPDATAKRLVEEFGVDRVEALKQKQADGLMEKLAGVVAKKRASDAAKMNAAVTVSATSAAGAANGEQKK